MNANLIVDFVNKYCEDDTADYAVLLKGKWGCGKTYFVEKTLIPQLKRECLVIKISLFGVERVNDIFDRINASFVSSFVERGNSSLFQNIFSGCLSFLENKFAINLSGSLVFEVLQKSLSKLLEVAEKKRVFYIFDDFERVNIDYQILMGNISRIINGSINNSRCLIISNEEFILQKKAKISDKDERRDYSGDVNDCESNSYSLFKEKLIGYEIDFDGGLCLHFDDIVNDVVKIKQLQSIIALRKYYILQCFKNAGCQNLRTLRFMLRRFVELFELIKPIYHSEWGNEFLCYIFANILHSVCVTCIWYRDFGKRNFYDLGERMNQENGQLARKIKAFNKDGLVDVTIENLVEEHISCYNCVDEYVYQLSFDRWIWEEFLDYMYEIAPTTAPRIIDVCSIFLSESDDIANQKLKVVIEDLQKNLYDLEMYPNICTSVYQLIDMFFSKLERDKLLGTVEQIIETNVMSCNNALKLHWHFWKDEPDNEMKIFLKNLLVRKQKEDAELRKKKLRGSLLFSSTSFLEGMSEHVKVCQEHFVTSGKCLSFFPIELIINGIKLLNAAELRKFEHILSQIYALNCVNLCEFFSGEVDFFKQVIKSVEEYSNSLSGEVLRKMALDNLIKFLNDIVAHIDKQDGK